MNKILNIIIGGLAIIALIGVLYLLSIGKTVEIVMPILSALVGYLIGGNKETVAGYFKKK